jgi:class 3 adenylate cyclase
MEMPHFKFAIADDGARIAYQTFGSGPAVIVVPEILASLAVQWESDFYQRAWEHLANHVTLVLFDKRGTGMSDHFEGHANLSALTHDIEAIVRTESMSSVSLIGTGDGAIEAVAFAARNPGLVDRLVLSNPGYGPGTADDHPDTDEADFTEIAKAREEFTSRVLDAWGSDAVAMTQLLVPSLADDPSAIEWFARFQRLVISRGQAMEQLGGKFSIQLGDVPQKVTVPTLITHTVGNKVIPIASGRYLAAQIQDVTLIEIPAADHVVLMAPYWRDVVDAHISFITGTDVEAPVHRRFAVVLFTDFVGSTSAAIAAGDEQWAHRLDAHDRAATRLVSLNGGTIVKSTGDGLLATFDSLSGSLDASLALVDELGQLSIPIRAGLHAGEIELRGDDVSGSIVNLAARVMGAAGQGQVFTTSAIRDGLVGSRFEFTDVGRRTLKGFEADWQLYRLNPVASQTTS